MGAGCAQGNVSGVMAIGLDSPSPRNEARTHARWVQFAGVRAIDVRSIGWDASQRPALGPLTCTSLERTTGFEPATLTLAR